MTEAAALVVAYRGRVGRDQDEPRSLGDRPDLVADLHPTRNGGVDPRAIAAGSILRLWWRCPNGHHWEARVVDRVKRGAACPQCAGPDVAAGIRTASRSMLEAAIATANRFRLAFDPSELPRLAVDYSYGQDESFIIERIAPVVRKRGHFTRNELLEVCRWKTPRSVPRVVENTEEGVVELTRTGLGAAHDELRIGSMLHLAGVDWPSASVLLHFGHEDRYPIIDFRALEALGIPRAKTTQVYSMAFWLGYVIATRRLADTYGMTMRELDRALWQWSDEQGA